MGSGARIALRVITKARLGAVLALLAMLPIGATGCGISLNEPLYGNYNKSETTRLQRRSDIRECERRHQRSSGGPANRKAAFTQGRVEQCLELQGYKRRRSAR